MQSPPPTADLPLPMELSLRARKGSPALLWFPPANHTPSPWHMAWVTAGDGNISKVVGY